jgi:hypothetical protein
MNWRAAHHRQRRALRVNYQVDGSNNTQKDRAGLRQMPMSKS